jgi:flavin reductase ActVB
MIAINNHNYASLLLEKAETSFAVNILAADEQELSNRFAWVKDEDRFAMGEWTTALTGAPILADAVAWLDCTIHSQLKAGTHTIYVGEVRACGVPRQDEAPLLYWNRDYRELAL